MEKPKAIVDREVCLACGGCISVCPRDAITMIGQKSCIDKQKCTGCEICIKTCPVGAIEWEGD
jgi:Fe-S-cluster-containing hydrogenase component 2